MQPLLFPITLTLFVSLAGCSTGPRTDYSQVELVQVYGNVTLDGRPLPDAVVTFTDLADGTFSFAMTDANGGYTLRFDSVKLGCTPGTKKVEISTRRRLLGLNVNEEEGDPDEKKPAGELVPARYNKDTELKVEVSATSRNHDFALTSS